MATTPIVSDSQPTCDTASVHQSRPSIYPSGPSEWHTHYYHTATESTVPRDGTHDNVHREADPVTPPRKIREVSLNSPPGAPGLHNRCGFKAGARTASDKAKEKKQLFEKMFTAAQDNDARAAWDIRDEWERKFGSLSLMRRL
jgi:hypothetical protein